MKEEIFIFGNSMCCTPSKESYLDLLKQDYDVNGMWMRGMTIWHVNKYLRNIVRGDNSWIIINVGIVEAVTRKSYHVLYYWLNELLSHDADELFKETILPYLQNISLSMDKEDVSFWNIIPSGCFLRLFELCLKKLESYRIIVVGPAYPKPLENTSRFSICINYASILKNLEKIYFIDTWNKCKEDSIDDAHLNANGHKKIYNLIKEKING